MSELPRILQEMGAEVVTKYHRNTDYCGGAVTPAALARYRSRARRQTAECDDCRLCELGHGPVPMTVGRGARGIRAPFAVVGEAPGPEEDRKKEVFIGPAGRFLRSIMESRNLDPDRGVWLNAVSCVPRDKDMGKFRLPTTEEQLACRGNMLRQLEASGAQLVMLAGSVATGAFRPDLRVTKATSRFFVWHLPWGDALVMPVLHPSGVLRNKATFPEFRLGVELFAAAVEAIDEDDFRPLEWLELQCIRCGKQMYQRDRDGVAYCEEHWERYKYSWRRAGEKWEGKVDLEKVRLRGGRKKGIVKGKDTNEDQIGLGFEEGEG